MIIGCTCEHPAALVSMAGKSAGPAKVPKIWERSRRPEIRVLAAIAILTISLSSYEGDALQVLNFPALLLAANATSASSSSSQPVSLQLSSGTYYVTQSAIFDFKSTRGNITISGQGPDSTILDCNHNGVAPALVVVGAGSVTLEGIRVQNCNTTRPDLAGGGAFIQAYDEVIIRDTVFLGCARGQGGAVCISAPGQGQPSAPPPTNVTITVQRSAFGGNIAYGQQGGGALKILGITGSVAIDNCLFQDSFTFGYGGAVAMFAVNASVAVTNTGFFNNGASRWGGAVCVNNSRADVTIDGCNFQGNYGPGNTSFGGAVQVSYSNGSVDVSNTNFTANSAGYASAFFLVYFNGNLNFSNCIVKDNTVLAQESVSCIQVEGLLDFHGVTFYNNTSEVNIAALYVGRCTARITISDSLFQANTGQKDGIGLMVSGLQNSVTNPQLDGSVFIYNTLFDNNIVRQPDEEKSAIKLINIYGSVKVEKTNFTNHLIGRTGVLLLGPIGGTIQVVNCWFRNNSASYAMAALYSTQILVSGSTFIDNKAGYGLRLGGGSTLVVNSTFDNNFPGMLVDRGYLEVHACRFLNNMGVAGAAIYAQDGSVLRIDLGFYYPDTSELAVDALGLFKTSWRQQAIAFEEAARTWSPTTFVNNTAYVGGAIAVIDSQLRISTQVGDMPEQVPYASNTSFIRNKALTGGAIAIVRGFKAEDSQVELSYTWLQENEAVTPDKLPASFRAGKNESAMQLLAMQYGMGVGNGGAIAAVFTRGTTPTMINSTFISNIADGYGGGMYLGVLPSECSSVDANCYQLSMLSFIYNGTRATIEMNGNVARGGAGGAIYYEGLNTVRIYCEPVDIPNPIFPCEYWRNNSAPVGPAIASTPSLAKASPSYITNYTSGQDLQIDLTVYDVYGHLHAPPQPNPRLTDVAAFTVVDAAASGQLQAQVGGSTSAAQSSFRGLRLRMVPGNHTVNLTVTVPELKRILSNITLTLDVRPCVLGEASLENDTLCKWCDAGQYSTDSKAGCFTCPANSLCNQPAGEQQGIIVPVQQYWNSNPFSEQVHLCPNADACQFPNRTARLMAYQDTLRQDPSKYNRAEFYAVMCAKGYTGNFCTMCAPGYGYVGSAQCAPCYSRGASAFIYALVTIISLLPFFFAYLSESSASSEYWAIEMESWEEEQEEEEEEEEEEMASNTKSTEQGAPHKEAVSSLSFRKGTLPDLEMPAEPEKKAKREYVDEFETLSSIIKVALSYLQVTSLMKFIILPTFPSTFDNTVDVAETVTVFPGNAVSLHCALPEDLSIQPSTVTVALALTLPLGAELVVAVLVLVAWYLPTYYRNLRARAAARFPSWKWIQSKGPEAKDDGDASGKDNDARASEESHGPGKTEADAPQRGVNHWGGPDTSSSKTKGDNTTQLASKAVAKDATTGAAKGEQNNASASVGVVDGLEHKGEKVEDLSSTVEEKAAADEERKSLARLPLAYKLALVIIVGTFAFYEHFVTTFLNILACVSGDSDNTSNKLAIQSGLLTGYWWRYDFSQRCFEGTHAALAYVIAIPGIIVFAVGCPVWTCWYLGHNRYQLELPAFKALWGFVYAEYTPSYFAWESVIMLRKISISMLVVLLSSSPNNTALQLLSGMAVIAAALVAHQTCQPYVERQVSKLETLSLTTTLISLYLSSYAIVPTMPNSYAVIAWIIIAINIFTMAVFAWNLYTALLDSVLTKVGINSAGGPHNSKSPSGGMESSKLTPARTTSIELIQQKLDPIVGKRLAVPSAYVVQGLAKAHTWQRKAGNSLNQISSATLRRSRKLLGWDVEAQQQAALSRGKSGSGSGPLSQRSLAFGQHSQRASSGPLHSPRTSHGSQRARSIALSPRGQQAIQHAGSSGAAAGDNSAVQSLPSARLWNEDASLLKEVTKLQPVEEAATK